MTLRLFNSILTTCLVFGSLNLHAEQARKATPAEVESQNKKLPEALFLEGSSCLKLADTTCANVALAT